MSEHIIPVDYEYNNYGISVRIAGLDNTNYNSIEILLEGAEYYSISVIPEDNHFSSVASFHNLIPRKTYTVCAKLTYLNGEIKYIQAKMSPQTFTHKININELSPEELKEKFVCGAIRTVSSKPIDFPIIMENKIENIS